MPPLLNLLNSSEDKQGSFCLLPRSVFGLCVARSVMPVFAVIALAKTTSRCGFFNSYSFYVIGCTLVLVVAGGGGTGYFSAPMSG